MHKYSRDRCRCCQCSLAQLGTLGGGCCNHRSIRPRDASRMVVLDLHGDVFNGAQHKQYSKSADELEKALEGGSRDYV